MQMHNYALAPTHITKKAMIKIYTKDARNYKYGIKNEYRN